MKHEHGMSEREQWRVRGPGGWLVYELERCDCGAVRLRRESEIVVEWSRDPTRWDDLRMTMTRWSAEQTI